MKPIFMDKLLQLRILLKDFRLTQGHFVIHLSRRDALELLEYNNIEKFNFSNINDFEGHKIYDFTIKNVGMARETFIEICP